MTAKLALVPDASGYSFEDAADYLQWITDGGLPRTRKDILDGNRNVTVTFICEAWEYEYLNQFIAANLLNNSEPFLIDLILDLASPTEHTVTIIPDSMRLTQQAGRCYVVSLGLEVRATALSMAGDGDGDDSGTGGGSGNAGVGTPGEGYYPGSAVGSPYNLWDRWHFEEATTATTLTGENGHTMSIYNDDSAKINTSQFYEGSKSVRKGGGSPMEGMPTLPSHARWSIDFYCYFPSLITSSTGFMLRISDFSDYCSFDVSGSDQVVLTGAGATSTVISLAAWHHIEWRVTATAREWYIDGVLVRTDTRASLGIGSAFTVDWTIGRGGYDYYYSSYWFVDLVTCSYAD